ncbi:MAG: hydrogenase subunit MbhD domain-containing protein [Candidatus Altiarchaeota archaeon]
MIEYVLMVSIIAIAAISLFPKDLMKAVIIGTGIEGLALAVLYQQLLASDVALTQAIIASTVLPGIFALAVYRTQRCEE